MAFTDYLDLRTAVLEVVGRTDITDIFDRLTLLAESRFNRKLRCGDQITDATVTVSGGTGTLPSDYRQMIGVYDGQGCEYVQQPIQAVQITQNSFYAVSGSNLIAPDREYSIQYYAAIPTLTTSATTTNWLLSKYPDVYLYGVASEAAKNKRDSEILGALEQYRNEAIDDANEDDDAQRYSRARVRLQGNIE